MKVASRTIRSQKEHGSGEDTGRWRYPLMVGLLLFQLLHPTLADDPFFKTVYLMGSACNGTDALAKYLQEGIRQLSLHSPDINAKVLCHDDNTTNSNPNIFRTQSLSRVVQEVGGVDGLTKTAVVMACHKDTSLYPDDVTAEECLDTSVSLIRKGLTVFFLEDSRLYRSPSLSDYPPLNLETDRLMIIEEPSLAAEREAATLVGRELCRQKRESSTLRYAKVYQNITTTTTTTTTTDFNHTNNNNQRIDIMVQAFQQACPTTELHLLWELYEVKSSSLSAKLRRVELPDVVFTASDNHAEQILKIARDTLSADNQQLSTIGWYHAHPGLVQQRQILITVDTMVWQRIIDLIDLVEHQGVRSTRGWQQKLGLAPDAISIEPPRPTVISSDPEGYLLEHQSYNTRTSPSPTVEVSTGLLDVTIAQFWPFEQRFEAKLTQKVSWVDPRLQWDSFVYKGSLSIDREDIWTPQLYFENDLGSVIGTIFAPPATVHSNGTVVLETTLRTTFFCSTGDGLKSYPFDSYHCSMDLASLHSWLSLDAAWGYNLVSSDPSFTTTISLQEELQVIHYQIYLQRIRIAGWLRLVIPLVLINLVGFMSFWIPGMGEKVALGVTSLLCAIAFRATVEMPPTAAMTWSDAFLLFNVVFQILVLFITYCSYNVVLGSTLDLWLQSCCSGLQPHRYDGPKEKTDKAEEELEEWGNEQSQSHPPSILRRRNPRKFSLYSSSVSSSNAGFYPLNVDWFGRWIVVPAYFLLLVILLIYGSVG